MTDPELEELLRRYRPAGPPPELRARVLADAVPVRRTWPWAAAAAALLAVVCVTRLRTHNVYERLAQTLASTQTPVAEHSPDVTSAMENDPLLRARLEALARLEQSQDTPGVNTASSWQ